jgi:pyridoxine 5-phosphate synthase
MLKLGVNIDHIATLREARYRGRETGEPDPVVAALACEEAGAHGITAHLREDRRHIQDRDVWRLREALKTRLNLEMASVPAIVETRKKMNGACIEVSLFITSSPDQIEAAARTGSQFVELHTGAFANHFLEENRRDAELQRLIAGAQQARALGLKVNAGHGLNYENLTLLRQVPHLVELNIGHSIVSRAVLVGIYQAVREMLELMGNGRGTRNPFTASGS